ncbi:dihydrofolate reductase, partial [Schumannella luteola]
MARIRYDTATTLDGRIADPANSLAWLFSVPGSSDAEQQVELPDAAVQVMGSTTYLWVLDELAALEHPEKWAASFAATPVFVFTRRDLPTPAGADVRFVNAAVADALPAIRAAAGDGDIWVVGGGDLAGQFLDA